MRMDEREEKLLEAVQTKYIKRTRTLLRRTPSSTFTRLMIQKQSPVTTRLNAMKKKPRNSSRTTIIGRYSQVSDRCIQSELDSIGRQYRILASWRAWKLPLIGCAAICKEESEQLMQLQQRWKGCSCGGCRACEIWYTDGTVEDRSWIEESTQKETPEIIQVDEERGKSDETII
jgi:hypothetical protein